MLRRVGADIPRQRADEGAFNMDPGDRVADMSIRCVKLGQPLDAGNHTVELVGDHRGQHPAAAVSFQSGARLLHGRERKVVGIKIHAPIAVELQFERGHACAPALAGRSSVADARSR